MVYVNNISLKYGDRELLRDVSFVLSKKERVGLIGKNGAGKSTLFKIISNQISSDEGNVQFPSGFSMGLLKQDLDFDLEKTVMEETKTAFAEILSLQEELQKSQAEIAKRTDYESAAYMDLIHHMTEVNSRLDMLGGDQIQAQCEKILKGLGFGDEDFNKKIGAFSGGWQMRVELAKLLLTQPDLLLLDEPTNHLDIESIIWLEQYLQDYEGIVLLISHDIQFLDNVCNKIVELELGRATVYTGNYHKYLQQRAANKEIMLNAYQNQQKELAQKEKTIARFMAKATKTSMAQSMQKQLDKVERIEIPEESNRTFRISFGDAPRSGQVTLDVKGIKKSYGAKKVLDNVNIHIERGDKIAFVGQNGQGKTTLAKLIVGQIQAEEGRIVEGSNVKIAYYAQNQSELLDTSKTILQMMEDISPAEQRPNIRNILGAFMFSGEDVEKKISVLSGGERARLAMAAMILMPSNVIIMDEPTNHLDIQSKEVLKAALDTYQGTLIVVSHDRQFLEGLSNKVYEFVNHNIKEYLGDINYFLEKKKLNDIREIQTKGVTSDQEVKIKQDTSVTPTLSYDQQKQMKRRLQYVERDIAKIEEEMKAIEVLMLDPTFYQSKDFDTKNTRYLEQRSQLEKLMEEWEDIVSQLGE